MKLIEDVIKYSVISARAGSVVTEDGFSTRLQLNVIIIAPFGSGKTSLFYELEKAGLGKVLNDYTMPGLVGTIKPNGLFIKGYIVKCAGGTMIIDEFQKFEKEARDALLNILEHHSYRRTLGCILQSPITEVGDYYSIHGESNYFEIYSKLSFIIGTMYFRIKTIDDLTLLSRCFPISMLSDEKQGFDLYLGKQIFKAPSGIFKLRDEIANENVILPKDIQEKLVKFTEEIYLKHKIEQGFITRGLWDLTRIAGLEALINDRDKISNEDIEKALEFLPLQIVGYARGTLTPAQIRVLDVIYSSKYGISTIQIAKVLKKSESTVSSDIRALEYMGLVKKVTIGNKNFYTPIVLGDISKRDIS